MRAKYFLERVEQKSTEESENESASHNSTNNSTFTLNVNFLIPIIIISPPTLPKNSNVLKNLLKNLTTAASYLHTLSSVHLDIKPSNIFCNYTSPSTIETVTCLLGDFGSGMKMIEGEMIDVEELKDITREYAPPEVVYPSGRGGVDLRKYDSWR